MQGNEHLNANAGIYTQVAEALMCEKTSASPFDFWSVRDNLARARMEGEPEAARLKALVKCYSGVVGSNAKYREFIGLS